MMRSIFRVPAATCLRFGRPSRPLARLMLLAFVVSALSGPRELRHAFADGLRIDDRGPFDVRQIVVLSDNPVAGAGLGIELDHFLPLPVWPVPRAELNLEPVLSRLDGPGARVQQVIAIDGVDDHGELLARGAYGTDLDQRIGRVERLDRGTPCR